MPSNPCPLCKGDTWNYQCPKCGGKGTVRAPMPDDSTACNTCHEPQNAAGYCINKQCSRHGRRNDYLAKNVAAPATDYPAEREREALDAKRWRAVRSMLHVVSCAPNAGYYLTSEILSPHVKLNAYGPDAFADAVITAASVPVEDS